MNSDDSPKGANIESSASKKSNISSTLQPSDSEEESRHDNHSSLKESSNSKSSYNQGSFTPSNQSRVQNKRVTSDFPFNSNKRSFNLDKESSSDKSSIENRRSGVPSNEDNKSSNTSPVADEQSHKPSSLDQDSVSSKTSVQDRERSGKSPQKQLPGKSSGQEIVLSSERPAKHRPVVTEELCQDKHSSAEVSSNEDPSINLIAPGYSSDEVVSYSERLIELYNLISVVRWIELHKFEKVCLQFPEKLLIDSVDIAAYIERHIKKKVFILGDSAYASCCVDVVGSCHVNGDAIIHFGHACLSPVHLPVFYVFQKKRLDIPQFFDLVENYPNLETPVLILYDVCYYHLVDELRDEANCRAFMKKSGCIANLVLPDHCLDLTICSSWCFLKSKDFIEHSDITLQRAYCTHHEQPFRTVVYIGPAGPNLFNFINVFPDCKIYHFMHGMENLMEVCQACFNKQLSYLVEKIRSAQLVGILVATLGVSGYKDAVDYAKHLCQMANKKSYIISIGKTTPAKLSNFSEMDIFVAVACPESDFGDKKQYMQPIVGMYELDLALNKARPWGDGFTRDFRDVIRGAEQAEILGRDREGSRGRESAKLSPSNLSPEESPISISSIAIPHVAANASMKGRHYIKSHAVETVATPTYNIHKLMAQQLADRNAMYMVHQMKTVDSFNISRMKAYQVTVQAPVKEAFRKHVVSEGKTKEFWDDIKSRGRATVLVKRPPYDMTTTLSAWASTRDSVELPDHKRDTDLDSGDSSTDSLSSKHLLSSQEIRGGRNFIEPKTDSGKEEVDEDHSPNHSLYHIIPRSVLDQLIKPANHQEREWKGLDQKLGEKKPSVLEKGRIGSPHTSYNSEPKH